MEVGRLFGLLIDDDDDDNDGRIQKVCSYPEKKSDHSMNCD